MNALLQKSIDLLRRDLEETEASLCELRPHFATGVHDTRRLILRLIERATAIRRELGLLPYTAAGLSPVVAVCLDLDGDRLIARVTHEDDGDDDTVFIGNLDEPRIASKVPADLFEEFEELVAKSADAIDARAECEADYRLAKGWR